MSNLQLSMKFLKILIRITKVIAREECNLYEAVLLDFSHIHIHSNCLRSTAGSRHYYIWVSRKYSSSTRSGRLLYNGILYMGRSVKCRRALLVSTHCLAQYTLRKKYLKVIVVMFRNSFYPKDHAL